ncbi:MAG: helix-turn-helix domain-containing protein [Burkholderiaceae bacterium]|nr:helix-turn-helix domain-containing protein [Burkholderiaceae bacterium]
MNLQDWLKKARGRQTALAIDLGIKPPQVSKWIKNKNPIPVIHMARIEAFTGGAVTRQEMCPSDWKTIWPELAEKKPNHTIAIGATALNAIEKVAQSAPDSVPPLPPVSQP